MDCHNINQGSLPGAGSATAAITSMEARLTAIANNETHRRPGAEVPLHSYMEMELDEHPFPRNDSEAGIHVSVASFSDMKAEATTRVDAHNKAAVKTEATRASDFIRYDLWNYIQWWELNTLQRPTDRPVPEIDEFQVRYMDLEGDKCDFQGINWEASRTTRQKARSLRRYAYPTPSARLRPNCFLPRRILPLSRRENFFRFKKMHLRQDSYLAHFQLRHLLASPTRSHIFYTSIYGLQCLDPTSNTSRVFINSNRHPDTSPITSLDANCGVAMAGSLHGSYYIRPYDNEADHVIEGSVSNDLSPFINSIRIHTPRRSASPVAAIASNDHFLRLMDLETQEYLWQAKFGFRINDTAVSPDRHLRVVVGDTSNAFILGAERQGPVQQLTGHSSDMFGCDWSEDGWTVATSSQDKTIKIWDARRWCNSNGVSSPLCTILCDMDGAPNIRFSPAGSGRRVLVASETDDLVHFIDAQTFESKQTFDLFGELGGISFSGDGQDLNVFCLDRYRGGVLQLERCGRGLEPSIEDSMVPRLHADRLAAEGLPWLSAEQPAGKRKMTAREVAPIF